MTSGKQIKMMPKSAMARCKINLFPTSLMLRLRDVTMHTSTLPKTPARNKKIWMSRRRIRTPGGSSTFAKGPLLTPPPAWLSLALEFAEMLPQISADAAVLVVKFISAIPSLWSLPYVWSVAGVKVLIWFGVHSDNKHALLVWNYICFAKCGLILISCLWRLWSCKAVIKATGYVINLD